MNTKIPPAVQIPISILALLLCFALPQIGHAADAGGVLTNGNTADGSGVLINLTSGVWNTGLGFETLNHDTTGGSNTAEGVRALFSNTTGSSNTATGVYALYSNTSGGQNTASGQNALHSNTSGTSNTATGFETLFKNNGAFNTATGYHALYANTTGAFNTASGHQALASNTSAIGNTASGVNALVFNTIGAHNAAFGDSALYSNTNGRYNNAVGYLSLYANTSGIENVAVGERALGDNQTGSGNVGIGTRAGSQITGNGNICIGTDVQGSTDDNHVTRIDNIGATPIASNYLNVVITEGTKLGYASSSRRYKKEIKPMANASGALFLLKPVTYRGKEDKDPRHAKSFGLIAEEVADVNPDLVAFNKEGAPETVRYDAVNAMLLNEFLKEHQRVQELTANAASQGEINAELRSTIAQQQKGMEALAAQVKEQASHIQKVTAQLALTISAPRIVDNKQLKK